MDKYENLEKKGIIELRVIGKELGIKSVTTYKKNDLLEKIKEALIKESSSKLSNSDRNINNQTSNGSSDKHRSYKSNRENYPNHINKHNKNITDDQDNNPRRNQENIQTQNRQDLNEKDQFGNEKNQSFNDRNYNDKGQGLNLDSQGNDSNETYEVEGFLEIIPDGFGFLRGPNYLSTDEDVYVSPSHIRRFNMKTGDMVKGISKKPRNGERFNALIFVKTINNQPLELAIKRKPFEKLTPIYPDEKLNLQTESGPISTRIMDLFSPVGKGQRGLIVAPPKAGKTVLLKSIANAITENHKDIDLIVLLIDERPEEVTDMKESIDGEVIFSTFDQVSSHHTKVAEMVLARAQRLVEHGRDVVILLDSITRLARAYNLEINPTGRTLSGGIDPGALHGPKKLFGAARNIREGGSLTILGTALIETGSRMDDVIYEEFKGTGNMEIHLDRKLAEKRIFPAFDIYKSGTRREDLLLTSEEQEILYMLRREMDSLDSRIITENIIEALSQTDNNQGFIDLLRAKKGSIFKY